jgi:hypothetical protein
MDGRRALIVCLLLRTLAACGDDEGGPALWMPQSSSFDASPARPPASYDAGNGQSTQGAVVSDAAISDAAIKNGAAGGQDAALELAEHPAWLLGLSYTTDYEKMANVSFEARDRGLLLGGAPDYEYSTKLGKNWTFGGKWETRGDRLRLIEKYYGSVMELDMRTAFEANCRVLNLPEGGLGFVKTRVSGCPYRKALSAEECAQAGTYEKARESGSSSSHYSSSETYTLESDGFFHYQTASTESVCYETRCKTLSNVSAPLIGSWKASGKVITGPSGAISVAGYEFTPSSQPCVR